MTDEQIRAMQAEIAAELGRRAQSEQQPQQPATPTTPEKFSFAGQEWATKEQAEAAAMAAFRAREEKIAQLEAERQQRANQPPPQVVAPGAAPTFDKDKYLKTFVDDPMGAARMQLSEMLFAGMPALQGLDPAQVLRETMFTAHAANQRLAELEMRANHPEVPWHDNRAIEAIEKMREAIQMPNNAQGRERAIEALQARGFMPNRQRFEQERQQQFQQAPQPGNVQQMPSRPIQPWETPSARPAPTIPYGGSTPGDMSVEDFETYFAGLPLEQQIAMRDALRRKASGE
jgi:hypothetical protein